MESREYKIVQASTKALLFRKCQCGGFSTPVVLNDFVLGEEILFCDKCKKVITDFKTTFKLSMVVMDMRKNKLESIIAYDNAVADFIGCLPRQYFEYLKQDKLLSKRLEEQLVGMYCSALLDQQQGKDPVKKAKKLQLLVIDPINLIDIVRNTVDDIHFA